MEKFSTYFCVHFVRGCCAEGANCRFYHRIPTFEDCLKIDQIKDIYGRSRFANQREDMEGVGSFLKECRTLYVGDFRMPEGNDPIRAMYEVLWRHFSAWGEIEDINLMPGKGLAFVRYAHRCLAEIAKEAMRNQALDSGEILVLKWAHDDEDPLGEKAAEEKKKIEEEKKNKKRKHRKPKDEVVKMPEPEVEQTWDGGYGKESDIDPNYEENDIIKKKKKELEATLMRMNAVLQRIDNPDDNSGDLNYDVNHREMGVYGEQNQGDINYYSNVQGNHEIPPDQNNLPLFMK